MSTSPRATYFAFECADLLGMSLATFYRQRDALHRRGMPAPITGGKLRIDRLAFDAWRRGKRAPPVPANDVAGGDIDWHDALAREYRPRA